MNKKHTNINQIEDDLSISRATAYRISSGEKSPCLDDLEDFARVLNVPIEDLYYSKYSRK